MDYISTLNETRTNAEQSETGGDFRVSYESRTARQGAHLYFIKIAKGRSPVKIGRANEPLARLATLQVACPYTLKLLGVLKNCGDAEPSFHRFLGESRLRGEWFAWSCKVEALVKLALGGGDWRKEIAEKPRVAVTGEEWWVGSPLYDPAEQRHVRA